MAPQTPISLQLSLKELDQNPDKQLATPWKVRWGAASDLVSPSLANRVRERTGRDAPPAGAGAFAV
ncbi:hypothetical protein BD413DRAFT_576830 [Trametes elegans]|nr:hypothetical protein BD413DRAFT_576830 [Trametes elegans]